MNKNKDIITVYVNLKSLSVCSVSVISCLFPQVTYSSLDPIENAADALVSISLEFMNVHSLGK